MTKPYLITHLVRGQPAFDIAERMTCPECHDANSCGDYAGPTCDECNGLGFWWICSTSGARARPWWTAELVEVDGRVMLGETENPNSPGDPPPNWPDHYPATAPKATPRSGSTLGASLLAKLGLGRSHTTIKRRL